MLRFEPVVRGTANSCYFARHVLCAKLLYVLLAVPGCWQGVMGQVVVLILFFHLSAQGEARVV